MRLIYRREPLSQAAAAFLQMATEHNADAAARSQARRR
jgi:hypothetical protein